MPRIDLYLLKEASFSEQITFCCRLCDKAIDKHSRIHIQTIDAVQNEALNTALWSFKSDSFIPHGVGQAYSNQAPPVIIDSNDLDTQHQTEDSLLILLRKELPNDFSVYKRLCVIVPNIEQEIQDARTLFRQLKKLGHEVHIHDMR